MPHRTTVGAQEVRKCRHSATTCTISPGSGHGSAKDDFEKYLLRHRFRRGAAVGAPFRRTQRASNLVSPPVFIPSRGRPRLRGSDGGVASVGLWARGGRRRDRGRWSAFQRRLQPGYISDACSIASAHVSVLTSAPSTPDRGTGLRGGGDSRWRLRSGFSGGGGGGGFRAAKGGQCVHALWDVLVIVSSASTLWRPAGFGSRLRWRWVLLFLSRSWLLHLPPLSRGEVKAESRHKERHTELGDDRER